MEDLRGKHVLVTGATGAVGPTLVATLLVSGATVSAVARRRTALDALRADHPRSDRLHVAEADVAHGEHVEALLDALERGTGPLDAVVHAVAAHAAGPLTEVTEATIDLLFQSVFRSATLVLRGALRRMLPRRRGRVVLVGALPGQGPTPGRAVFGALEAALAHLAQSAAMEARGHGVNVNALLVGRLEPAETSALDDGLRPRGALPADVARAVAVLLGDSGRGVNGALLAVPGELQ